MNEKYVTQKAQKITSALYLITDLIKDTDAIKWEIREEGITLVSSSLMLNASFPVEKEHALKTLNTTSEKIISFLGIAKISSLISEMNSSIVINEIESLVVYINKNNKETLLPGYILSDTFFSTDLVDKTDKGQDISLKTIDSFDKNLLNNEPKIKDPNRQDIIIDLLKKNSNLTIKDFVKVIKNCSEKTIQRELISLVKKGVIKKQGERRWSTYSLS